MLFVFFSFRQIHIYNKVSEFTTARLYSSHNWNFSVLSLPLFSFSFSFLPGYIYIFFHVINRLIFESQITEGRTRLSINDSY